MVDLWGPKFPVSKSFEVPVVLINDLNDPVKGELKVRLLQGDKVIDEKTSPFQMDALGKTEMSFNLNAPNKPTDDCEVIAELTYGKKKVKSYRDVTFVAEENDNTSELKDSQKP